MTLKFTTLCFYGYRNMTLSKVTGNVLANTLHAFHRFNKRYHVNNNNLDQTLK